MNEPYAAANLPPELVNQLNEVRARHRRVQLQTGLLLGAAILLGCMLAAMLVDWLAVLRSPALRWTFTIAALGCGFAGFVRWALVPLWRPPSLDAYAREIDLRHPFLQERYLTLTEFARNADSPEIRGSPAMMHRVAEQAASLSTQVEPMSVISRQGLQFAAKSFLALGALLVVLFAVDFRRAVVLAERFWLPGADISLTRLDAKSGDLRIGKGENVALEVVASGKIPTSATIFLRSGKGDRDEVVMRADATNAACFDYSENAVTESFEYQVRAGDGQTAWHRVSVVDRPRIAQLDLRITAPAYSKLPPVEETTLPHLVRALEGSMLDLAIQADQPLTSMALQLDDGKSVPLTEDADHFYRYHAVLAKSFTFQPVLTNPHQMDNSDKSECEVVVYPDEPPTVRVLTPNDQISAGSSEKIKINFEARDDFGIARAELDVSLKGESNTVQKVIPIPLEPSEQGAKLVRKQVDLDLAEFNLQQGDDLTYVVKVADTKNAPAQAAQGPAPSQNLAGNQGNTNSPPDGASNSPAAGRNQPGPVNPALAQNGRQNQNTNQSANQGSNSSRAENQNQSQNGNQNQASAGNQNQNTNGDQAANSSQSQSGNQNQNQTRGSNPNQSPNQNQNVAATQNPDNGQNGSTNQDGTPGSNQEQSGNQNANQSQSQSQSGSQNQNQAANQNQSPAQSQTGNQKQNQNQGSQTAQNDSSSTQSQQQKQSPPQNGDQPPPNDMAHRSLPGQTASARPQTIKVDDWGGTFEEKEREKKEIAIDAVVKQLEELLAKAQDGSDTTLTARRATSKLDDSQMVPLTSAQESLRQADSAVDDLREKSDGTPYAFVGLQMRDIRDSHVTPARDELGDVTGESIHQTNDVADLDQASYHIAAARKALADLTRTYDDAKRDNKVESAAQHIAKMHQLFIEDMQALLNSHRQAINSQDRKVAEVSDDFADKMQKLLEEQKKVMDELAKTLAEDPRMLRRFLALQQLDSVTLRDQLTLQARRQEALSHETAAWTNGTEADHAVLLKQMLGTQTAEQLEIADLAVKMRENMLTWWPLDAPTNGGDFTGALGLAADAALAAGGAIAQHDQSASLTNALQALDKFRQIYDQLPALETNEAYTNLGSYIANRMEEDGELISKESGWIKKIQSLRAGDLAPAVEVDQHQLTVDSTTLEQKLDTTAVSLRRVSSGVAAHTDALMLALKLGVLPEESAAEEALDQPDVPEAAERQAAATNGFARAEHEFDEVLRLLAERGDQAPPPTGVQPPPSLDAMLEMLKNEQKLAEQLGLSGRPLNVSIMSDWMNPQSGSSGGGSSGGQAQASGQAARQQAQASQRQAENARRQARNPRNRPNSNRYRNPAAGAGPADPSQDDNGDGVIGDAAGLGPTAPVPSWNTLVSKLGEEIRQGRDNVPPEQYRAAIEHYFEQISETMPMNATPAKPPAPAAPAGN